MTYALPINAPMPDATRMRTIDEQIVHAPCARMFAIASAVEEWPVHLSHYRYVRRIHDIVEMSANRPFGIIQWPTWWQSLMWIDDQKPAIRFHHIGGITKGMDVEWTFHPMNERTHVRIVHCWNGPQWPLIGGFAATAVIGPVFIHAIASRTLAGLARYAEELS